MSILLSPIQLLTYTIGILAIPCILLAWLVWRGKVKKTHAVLAYRALEERCRDITALAAKTWPVLEPLRGAAYTAALFAIFRDANALNEAVHAMLRPGDSKGFFDPIEAVKFAAAREGELQRVEECLREMDHDHATSNFRTVTPANRVGEMVGWLRSRAGQHHPNGAAFGRKNPMADNIQYLARQLHDIVRALEDAEYPTDNPAQTILQLLNTDRSVHPFPSAPLPPSDSWPILEGRIKALHAQLRRTIDVCAPFAIGVTFADDLPMYVRTCLEFVQANSFTQGTKSANERALAETRGRKSKAVELVGTARALRIIDDATTEKLMELAKKIANPDRPDSDTVVNDGEAS